MTPPTPNLSDRDRLTGPRLRVCRDHLEKIVFEHSKDRARRPWLNQVRLAYQYVLGALADLPEKKP